MKLDGDDSKVIAKVYQRHRWRALTESERTPIQGISLRLIPAIEHRYQIVYRIHDRQRGWSPWCKDGMQVFGEDAVINALQVDLQDRKV